MAAPAELYATVQGTMFWRCPDCQTINRTRKRAGDYMVQCVDVECRRHWIIAYRFIKPAGGWASRIPPKDVNVPIMQAERVERKWRSREPINALTILSDL